MTDAILAGSGVSADSSGVGTDSSSPVGTDSSGAGPCEIAAGVGLAGAADGWEGRHA